MIPYIRHRLTGLDNEYTIKIFNSEQECYQQNIVNENVPQLILKCLTKFNENVELMKYGMAIFKNCITAIAASVLPKHRMVF